MNLTDRIVRHAQITAKAYQELPSPPFLVLFIDSVCNMKCEHCFYWQSLNRRDDLTKEEIFELSRSLGRIENLSLSGGEPFLRKEFGEICRQFIRQNGVRQIYVPSNGWYTDKMLREISIALEEPGLELFVVELSLDGMPEFHDKFRVLAGAFQRAMQTYDALAELQHQDPRLRIHATSTATNVNVDEIKQLTTYLFDRCPQMDHHNLALIRGDRKNPSLLAPDPNEYAELYRYIRRLWRPREQGRYGSIVEPMLQWAKTGNGGQGDAGCPVQGRQVDRGCLCQRRCQRVRAAQAPWQPAAEVLWRDLGIHGSARAARIHRTEGVLLYHRGVPVAEYRFSAFTSAPDDAWRRECGESLHRSSRAKGFSSTPRGWFRTMASARRWKAPSSRDANRH